MSAKMKVSNTALDTKLFDFGLTVQEYADLLDAFSARDVSRIADLRKTALERISDRHIEYVSTKVRHWDPKRGDYTSARKAHHKSIRSQLLDGKEKGSPPTLLIIGGLPGSGKSVTRDQIMASDPHWAPTDPDAIRPYLYDHYEDTLYPILATQDESHDVADKLLSEALSKGISVIVETTLRDQTWIERIIAEAKGHGHKVEIVYIHRAMDECLKNIFNLRKRIVPLRFFISAVDGIGTLSHYLNHPSVDKLTIKDVTGLYTPDVAPQLWYQREQDDVLKRESQPLEQIWQDHATFLPLFER
jgi:predicted kinase